MPKLAGKPLKVAKNEPVTVRFKTDAVVAGWWVHLIVGDQAIRTWHGRTSDAAADEAIVSASDLKAGRILLWQLALFGSQQASIDYRMRIEYWQKGAKIGSDSASGTLKKGRTKGLSGARRIEFKS